MSDEDAAQPDAAPSPEIQRMVTDEPEYDRVKGSKDPTVFNRGPQPIREDGPE